MEIMPKYKTQFLRDLGKAEQQIKNGEVYTQEEVMNQLSELRILLTVKHRREVYRI